MFVVQITYITRKVPNIARLGELIKHQLLCNYPSNKQVNSLQILSEDISKLRSSDRNQLQTNYT